MSVYYIYAASTWMCSGCGLIFNWGRSNAMAVYDLNGKKIEKPMGGGDTPCFCPECGCDKFDRIKD